MAKTLDESVGVLLQAVERVSANRQRPDSLALGTVTAEGRDSLRVQCGGTVLTRENLWIGSGMSVSALDVGDEVVLLTQDQQRYYIICKVEPV